MTITLSDVRYSYQGKYQTTYAVNGVSGSFESGRLYAIVGKSGSGKTTLLSLLAGLTLPTAGEIAVDDEPMQKLDRSRLRRESVSVIYQNYNLFPLLNVSENIQYPLRLQGVGAKQAKETASRMREKVGLPEAYERRLPGQLSGGEQQRVAIARTLAQGSRVLLADEPTGNLDTENTRNIVEILKRLAHEEDCCVIIVTHDLAVAEQADVVLRMSDGKWVGEDENS